MYKRGGMHSLLIALLLFALMVGWGGYRQQDEPKVLAATTVNPLPVVGSREKLVELLKQSGNYYPRMYMAEDAMPTTMQKSKTAAPAVDAAGAVNNAKADEYSKTNTQVEGVDEADVIKTDGNYIYQVNRNRILIISAQNPAKMQVLSKLEFNENDFAPQEIYIDKTKLVVIGHTYINIPGPCYQASGVQAKCPPVYYNRQSTRALVYDIQNKSQLKKIRELEIEGSYVSSRKIGDTLYLISNENIYYANSDDIMIPYYKDTAAGSQPISIGYNQLRYFPDHIYPAFINIAAINTANTGQKAQVETYLGNAENIYASTGNLYIAASTYQQVVRPLVKDSAASSQQLTTLYKFSLKASGIAYSGKGEVPGTILNQFSMDEDKGYFRIATTTGEVWGTGSNISKNNVYVLNSDMKLVGRLEDIAPGEKIYSTRFMGDRAYMVTFKKVDPFFVISLKNPAKPYILGKLKIPGYSDYLHPYDENHIIGFGKDTIETKIDNGRDSMAFYQGLKVAVFDVTDVNNPKEMSKVIIGDRGTDSELLYNHKALLYSREKKLLAFPVTVMKIRESDKGKDISNWPAYGSFEFQGAYIYQIDLQKGLQFKGRITHVSQEELLKAGDSWYDSDKNIERIIYIGNNLFTLSPSQIQANAWSSLRLTGKLDLN
ncbi:MAG: beta-propeller domain-containing protein [Deltaproteobacteria bacterium]